MIPDGFNKHHKTHWREFIYRPVPPPVIRNLWTDVLKLNGHMYARAVRIFMEQQIVLADWECPLSALPDDELEAIFRVITQPTHHEKNLYRGACLALEYPHLATTSCDSCRHWWWNPLTGELFKDSVGQPVLRQLESVLLCQTEDGCPKGTPQQPIEFTAENAAAFRHYQMAAGQGCPDDHMTRYNWGIIQAAEHHVERKRQHRLRQYSPVNAGTTRRGQGWTRLHSRHVPSTGRT